MLYSNIHEVKKHLSKYLERVVAGERILICKRNIPIAELRGLPIPLNKKRPVGLAKGEFIVTDRFFDPLQSELGSIDSIILSMGAFYDFVGVSEVTLDTRYRQV